MKNIYIYEKINLIEVFNNKMKLQIDEVMTLLKLYKKVLIEVNVNKEKIKDLVRKQLEVFKDHHSNQDIQKQIQIIYDLIQH